MAIVIKNNNVGSGSESFITIGSKTISCCKNCCSTNLSYINGRFECLDCGSKEMKEVKKDE